VHFEIDRRALLARTAFLGAAATLVSAVPAQTGRGSMGTIRRVRAGVLDVGYHEFGPAKDQ
jgi:hypothetical protein